MSIVEYRTKDEKNTSLITEQNFVFLQINGGNKNEFYDVKVLLSNVH